MKTYLGHDPVHHRDIARITGSIHVSTSPLFAVRHVLSKLDGGRKGWLALPKHYRRYAIAATIQHHARNLVEYRQIMHGFKGEFIPRYYFDRQTKSTIIASKKAIAA